LGRCSIVNITLKRTQLTSVTTVITLFLTLLLPNASQGILIDFDLTLNLDVDQGLTYTNFTQAEDTDATSNFVIGFEIEITAVDGITQSLAPVAAFCSEIAESISLGSYSFTLSPLSSLAGSTAGNSRTASSSIPSGGIGDLRAARLAYLFDQFYISDVLTEWTQTEENPTIHAFQLAVWEITHDDGLDISSGEIALGVQTSGSDTTTRENAIILATSWVNAVAAANITSDYESSTFSFWSLTDDGSQYVILALEKNSTTETEFTEIVPEQSEYALFLGLGALSVCWGTQRTRKS
jgi:hypothetical protein